MCYLSRNANNVYQTPFTLIPQQRREANMITLKEILKKDEEQTNVPVEIKERLLVNILKQILICPNQTDTGNG